MSRAMNMMTEHPDEGSIHDYVDDELPADERARIAAHLDGCPACRELADSLVALREQARRAFGSAPEVEAADGWSGIEAAIEARRLNRRLSPLAAAASVALLLAAGAALYATMSGGTPDQPVPVVVAQAPADTTPATTIAVAYAPTLTELERILAEERGRLQPETVATLEANLAILNQAIREVEAALAADPAHRGHLRSLESIYQTKLSVLQQVVTLTTGA